MKFQTISLRKNTIANYFGQAYSIGIALISVPFFMKYLGSEAFGLIGFFTLIQSWMQLFDMGMSPTISREIAKYNSGNMSHERFIQIFRSLEFIFLVLSVIITLIILIFADFITQHWLNVQNIEPQILTLSIQIMSFSIGSRFLISYYRSGIIGSENQVWLNQNLIVTMSLKYPLAIVLLIFYSNNLILFFIYQLLVTIIELWLIKSKIYRILNLNLTKLSFSSQSLKDLKSFTFSIAYISSLWIVVTQIDKLIMSNSLSLAHYGYFVLIGTLSNSLQQVSNPISTAILPRLTALKETNNITAYKRLYSKASLYITLLVSVVTLVLCVYPYEIIYLWTQNLPAAEWVAPIVPYFILANALLAISAFQYYLQYSFGNLKYHVIFNSYYTVLLIIIIAYMAYFHGPLYVGFSLLLLRILSILFWVPFVHNKFLENYHSFWMKHIITPIIGLNLFLFILLKFINVNFSILTLVFILISVLLLNYRLYKYILSKIIGKFE